MSSSIDNGSWTHVRYAHACRPRDIDVACPRCRARARASKVSELASPSIIGDLSPSWGVSDWTVACTTCPHRAADLAYKDLPDLFWKTTVGDLEVWAWNRDHLVFLTKYLNGDATKDDAYGWFAAYVPGAWHKKRERIAKVIRDKLLAA
jgi:hypothetical protein